MNTDGAMIYFLVKFCVTMNCTGSFFYVADMWWDNRLSMSVIALLEIKKEEEA